MHRHHRQRGADRGDETDGGHAGHRQPSNLGRDLASLSKGPNVVPAAHERLRARLDGAQRLGGEPNEALHRHQPVGQLPAYVEDRAARAHRVRDRRPILRRSQGERDHLEPRRGLTASSSSISGVIQLKTPFCSTAIVKVTSSWPMKMKSGMVTR